MKEEISIMGNWDTIYKQFQQGGEAWATLSEDIDTRFITFIETNDFSIKRALDVGCGTGKYLLFLVSKGFKVDGIDSSPTAVEMTKKVVPAKSAVRLFDMYAFSYPKNTYDLILSVSTLHHGFKEQITTTITKIHSGLTSQGKVFITLPNFDARISWNTFREHTELAPGTYAPNSGPEAGLPHSFFTQREVLDLFSEFNNVTVDLNNIGRWFITGRK